MTASAKSVKGSTQSIDYLIEEHKGYELDRNLIYGDTSVEIMQSFRVQQMANTECEKKFFTAYISPDPKDGQKLTDIELKEISKDFMREIGVNPEKQAFLAVVHTEKNHKHIHLLINRIDEKNKAIKDNFSVLKAQNAAHKIATEKGLISARNVMNKKLEKVIEKDKETKAKIFEAHAQVMKIKPQSISKYVEYMKSLGYDEVAKICLTHSFNNHTIDEYIGKFDVTDEELTIIKTELAKTIYDEYDRLIQLCDCLAGAEGVLDIENRMNDVKKRYGFYPQDKWNSNMNLKQYFEGKMNKDIYLICEKDTFAPGNL